MKTNVGMADRAIRIGAGIILIILAATHEIGPWGWIGIVPLLTGFFRFCPVYPLLGISTCKQKK